MIELSRNQYRPTHVSLPGDTLAEVLAERQMTQADLARRIGRTPKLVSEVITGKAPISPETALLLEQVLSVPARFWNNLEQNYQEAVARAKDRTALEAHGDWLKLFPVTEMQKRGWLPALPDRVDLLQALLKYFGVASPHQWYAIWEKEPSRLRQSKAYLADRYSLAVWLRQGEIQAQAIACDSYSPERFRATLSTARALTAGDIKESIGKLRVDCARAGVALVFVEETRRIRASGATTWLSPSKALLQLSLRYKTDDQLWFTFFHEAVHILEHSKRERFVDDGDDENDAQERDANRIATDLLIAGSVWRRFVETGSFGRDSVVAFARSEGIAPGIVAGRLQHEKRLHFGDLADLKQRLDWDGTSEVTVQQESAQG
jgi:HTH-type transcriptional regulator/antitoxin HigA